MAAGRAAYLVRITRRGEKVFVETSIDGQVTASTPLAEATENALRTAVQGVTRSAKTHATTHTVTVDVEIRHEVRGIAITYTVNPSGETTGQKTTALETAPSPQRQTRKHEQPSTAQRQPRRVQPSGAHRATGFGPAAALPTRPTPKAQPASPPPPPPPVSEPEPPAQMAWANADAGPELDDEDTAPANPNLVPVTDRKVRIKKTKRTDDTDESLLKGLADKFRALSTIKKIGVIIGAFIVLLLGANILSGGSGDYTAICVDQRTGMRNLDPAPCEDGTVRFFLWYYIDSGETLPEPGTDYTSAPGTFDKPTSGTITYP